MADKVARKQQYEYRENSNMVLNVDYSLLDRRARGEPTGEVMPLNPAVLKGVRMGEKFTRAKAPTTKK